MLYDLQYDKSKLTHLGIIVVSIVCSLIAIFTSLKNRTYKVPNGRLNLAIFLTDFVFLVTGLFTPINNEPETFLEYLLAFIRLWTFELCLVFPTCKAILMFESSNLEDTFNPRRFSKFSVFFGLIGTFGFSLM